MLKCKTARLAQKFLVLTKSIHREQKWVVISSCFGFGRKCVSQECDQALEWGRWAAVVSSHGCVDVIPATANSTTVGHHIMAHEWGQLALAWLLLFLLKLSVWPLLQIWFQSSTNICDVTNYLTYWEKSGVVVLYHNSLSFKMQLLKFILQEHLMCLGQGQVPLRAGAVVLSWAPLQQTEGWLCGS